MAYKLFVAQINLYKEDCSPVLGELNTDLSIHDDGAGMYLEVKQEPTDFGGGGILRFDFDEIETLYKAMMILKQEADQIEEQ